MTYLNFLLAVAVAAAVFFLYSSQLEQDELLTAARLEISNLKTEVAVLEEEKGLLTTRIRLVEAELAPVDFYVFERDQQPPRLRGNLAATVCPAGECIP